MNTTQAVEQSTCRPANLDTLDHIQLQLRIEPLEMLKLSTHFHCQLRPAGGLHVVWR